MSLSTKTHSSRSNCSRSPCLVTSAHWEQITHSSQITLSCYTGALGADAVHLMALCELEESLTASPHSPMTQQMSSQRSRAHFGFAFLDAAAGRFYVGSATDDAARANLGAILTQVLHRSATSSLTPCRNPKTG